MQLVFIFSTKPVEKKHLAFPLKLPGACGVLISLEPVECSLDGSGGVLSSREPVEYILDRAFGVQPGLRLWSVEQPGACEVMSSLNGACEVFTSL